MIPHFLYCLKLQIQQSKAEQGDRQAKAQARERELLVRVLDIKSLTWSVLTPSGAVPPARGGHTVRLLSEKICVKILAV